MEYLSGDDYCTGSLENWNVGCGAQESRTEVHIKDLLTLVET